jgi:DHA1 family inner membrane transport protein
MNATADSTYQVELDRWQCVGVTLALSFAGFLALLNGQVTTPLLPDIARDLAVSASAIGQLVAAAGLAGVALGLFAGPLGDRHGRKLVLLLAAVSLALSCVGSALSQSYAVLFATRFGAGVGSVLLLPATLAAVGDFLPERLQPRAIGAVMAGTGLSLVVGWPLASISAGHWGWRGAFAVLSGLFGLLFLVLLLVIPTRPVASNAPSVGLGTYRGLLRDPGVRVALSSNAFAAAAWFAITTYLSVFLGQRFGMEGARQAPVLAATGVAYALGSSLGGAISNRFGTVALVGGCGTLATALVFLLPRVDYAPALAALFGLAALRGAGITVMTGTIVALRPTERGAVAGLNAALFSVGVAAGAAAGGLALARSGLTGLYGLSAALSAAGAAVLLLGRRALRVGAAR